MFSLIVAHSSNNIIGKNNSIPWFLPEDLKRFKEITTGKKIVMGRKTFESLPGILPKRHHIILTNNKNFKLENENVTVLNDISKFIAENKDTNEEIFIIGGGEIYELFYPLAKKLYITEVHVEIDGDTFFPKINLSDWDIDYESDVMTSNGLEFEYKNYKRKNPIF